MVEAFKTAGGVHNWSEFTIDEQRGIAYLPFGTGRFDFYGGNRKGANLYANCLLALRADTGKRVWHFQFVRHDVWDRDLPTAPHDQAVDVIVTQSALYRRANL